MRDASTRPSSVLSMLPYADNLFQGLEARFHRLAVGRLRINPDQRLRPARSQQHPAPVLEIELEAVVGSHALDPDARNFLRLVFLERLEDPLAVGVVRLARQMNVV